MPVPVTAVPLATRSAPAIITIPGTKPPASRRHASNPATSITAYVLPGDTSANSSSSATPPPSLTDIKVAIKRNNRLLGHQLSGHETSIVDLEFLQTPPGSPIHVLGSCDRDGVVFLWFLYVAIDALGIEKELCLLKKYSFFTLRKSTTAFYSRIRLAGSVEAGTMVLVPNDGANVRVVTFSCEASQPESAEQHPLLAPAADAEQHDDDDDVADPATQDSSLHVPPPPLPPPYQQPHQYAPDAYQQQQYEQQARNYPQHNLQHPQYQHPQEYEDEPAGSKPLSPAALVAGGAVAGAAAATVGTAAVIRNTVVEDEVDDIDDLDDLADGDADDHDDAPPPGPPADPALRAFADEPPRAYERSLTSPPLLDDDVDADYGSAPQQQVYAHGALGRAQGLNSTFPLSRAEGDHVEVEDDLATATAMAAGLPVPAHVEGALGGVGTAPPGGRGRLRDVDDDDDDDEDFDEDEEVFRDASGVVADVRLVDDERDYIDDEDEDVVDDIDPDAEYDDAVGVAHGVDNLGLDVRGGGMVVEGEGLGRR